MRLQQIRLIGTTNSGGTAIVVSEAAYLGLIHTVQWVDGDLADGVSFALSNTGTAAGVDYTILSISSGSANSDARWKPRDSISSLAGAVAVYTSDNKPIRLGEVVIDGKLTLVIANGGDTKTGGCYVYLLVND